MSTRQTARALRIIEYVGDPAWVEQKMNLRKIKGRVDFGAEVGYIQEAVIGDTWKILEYAALEEAARGITEQVVCPNCKGGELLDPRQCKLCGGTGWKDRSGMEFEPTSGELSDLSQKLLKAEREETRNRLLEEDVEPMLDEQASNSEQLKLW